MANRFHTLLAPILLSACLTATASDLYKPTPGELRASYQRAEDLGRAASAVYKMQVNPTWFGKNDRYFWYRNALPGDKREFILVECEKGVRAPAFDHKRLAESLSKATGRTLDGEKLPFTMIEITEDLKAVRLRYDDKNWECNLVTYEFKAIDPPKAGQDKPGNRENRSPDDKWVAEIRDGKVRVLAATDRHVEFESTETSFHTVRWAPDSLHLVAFRVIPGDRRQVFLIRSSPSNGGRAVMTQRNYDLPGDKLDTFETYTIDLAAKAEKKLDIEPYWTGGQPWVGAPSTDWIRGSTRYLTQITDRGYGRVRLEEVDVAAGTHRTLVDETSSTFVDTTNLIDRLLNDTDEMLWRSERDGFGRLYLIDTKTGALKNAITPSYWVVRSLAQVDEKTRRLIFTANCTDTYQDPYNIHVYAVGFDGKKLVRLTEGNGTHRAAFSPSHRYLVDTYSRVDSPPVHELRRVSDGKLVVKLEEADLSEWQAYKIPLPVPFVAKGRDGKTDIYGVMFHPSNYDPTKKYPVIENIYAGPQDSFVPKSFSAINRMQRLAELGFVVVQIDGMGTRNRGKKFHDVAWKNIADAGFADRIAWMRALAAVHPFADIERVGVYGTSAGGQNAAGAVLFRPEFYKVAVASCGCHDNRMDKFWWNEQWMGALGPHYEEQSNITNAGKLQGRLLLMLGELDNNVPPESTLRFVDALVKANKDFEFVMIPGADHTDGGAYGERKRRDFFVRHLLGVDPPVWNQGG